jgi:hypothetical protein
MQINANTTAAIGTNARLATLEELRANMLPQHIAPVPCSVTLRSWFDAAQIPRLKSNPLAKRGGGKCFYSVAHVEKFLRSRLAPKMMVNAHSL